MLIGWPWGPGRHREDHAVGVCSIQGDQVVATLPLLKCAGNPTTQTIPTGTPIYHVVADQNGVRNALD